VSSFAAALLALWLVATVAGAAVLLLVVGVQGVLTRVRRRRALRRPRDEPQAQPALG
jgi:hypothetical protein